MVAFSNAKGGRILIGVANRGIITGIPRENVDRINQLISNAASQHVRSPITVQTENILMPLGRVVIVLTVPKGIDKPYFDNHGVIWLKNGSDKRRVKVNNAPVNAPINLSLSTLQHEILKILNKDPLVSYDEIAVKLKKTDPRL